MQILSRGIIRLYKYLILLWQLFSFLKLYLKSRMTEERQRERSIFCPLVHTPSATTVEAGQAGAGHSASISSVGVRNASTRLPAAVSRGVAQQGVGLEQRWAPAPRPYCGVLASQAVAQPVVPGTPLLSLKLA